MKGRYALARQPHFSLEDSITAYLEFGREEAGALILKHSAAVLAIAKRLMIHRTLDAAMIDTIIANARCVRARPICDLSN
jgi:hypothetical protein